MFKHYLLQIKLISFQFSLFFLLISNAGPVFPQNIAHLNIEKVQEEGLSSDLINSISQDSNGFLWFGTSGGIFRYDGYNFKAVKGLPGDTVSLSNSVVICLYPENDKIWIGTLGGLSCIDINTQTVKNFPSVKPLQVYAISRKDEKDLWVGTTTGLFLYNKDKGSWQRVPGLGKNVVVGSISDDHNGHLYLSSNNGFYSYTPAGSICKHYQPNLQRYVKTVKNLPLTYVKSAFDHYGNIWFTTWNGGIVKFDPKTEKIESWAHWSDNIHLIPYKIATAILCDDDNNLWIANHEAGLTIFDPLKNVFFNYPIAPKSENALNGIVTCLFRDRSGTVWIGTQNGVFKYDPHNIHVFKMDMLLEKNDRLTQSNKSPLVMAEDTEGLLWIGTYDGLFTLDLRSGVLKACNKKIGVPPGFQVFSIVADKNHEIWLNEKNLLVKLSKSINNPKSPLKAEIYKSADIKTNIISLFIDNEHRIWVGTHGDGFFRFDQATKKFISFHYEEKDIISKINEVRTFCELSKDSILMGGENTGLMLLNPGKQSFEKIQWPGMKNSTGQTFINKIYKSGNNVWIGTEYDGLWQTDVRLNQPKVISINSGLPSGNITSMIADTKGNLWVLTNHGIAELHMPDKKITVFDKNQGIQDLSGLYAIITTRGGDILTGGWGMLYSLSPGNIIKNKLPPDVSIANLRVLDQDYPVQKNEKIRLNYNQNYFSIEYVALNYTQSRLNKYAYKMDGLDKKWNLAGPRRYVSYANLGEGTYTFEVKACNNEGIWNNRPAKLILVIDPPFWHRWWFYFLALMLVTGTIYTIYKYNTNQFKIRLQMRDKIASDLHDDIGSTLSGINIFSKIALQQMRPGQPGTELMEKISERSKKTMDALSDVVWSINTRNDGMDNFLMKANEYLAVLEVQDIGFDFTVDEKLRHLKIGMVLKKELYLIFKEAICNASKYANCTFIQIYLTRHKDICTLSIHDNGKGFDILKLSAGNGIYNMRQRAKRMDAEFHIESGENKGTTITLNFRITRFR